MLLTLSLAACDKDSGSGDGKVDIPTTQTGDGGGKGGIPATQTGSDDFQKNMHQSRTGDIDLICETEAGYYFQYNGVIYYGSAVFSDDYLCVLNDIPVAFYGYTEPEPGGMFRYYGDTIFVYGLDGTYIKEISLKDLYDNPTDMAQIDMICCSGNGIFFLTTGMSVSAGGGHLPV